MAQRSSSGGERDGPYQKKKEPFVDTQKLDARLMTDERQRPMLGLLLSERLSERLKAQRYAAAGVQLIK